MGIGRSLIDKRNKICAWCHTSFYDTSKRLSQKTCGSQCARAWGVSNRKKNGSYKRTSEQNRKLSQTLKKKWNNGDISFSDETRKKLSSDLKNRWKNGDMKEKVSSTSQKKYGTNHPMKSELVKENLKKTFQKKYGVDWATKNKSVKKKTQKTRLQKGLTYQFNQKTMKEWAAQIGVSYSYFKQVVNEQGFEAARKLSLSKTGIENIIESAIKEIGSADVLYDSFLFKTYRPDFLFLDKKLIIECDGLAWHCDRIKDDKFYHQNKKLFYQNKGYKSLFFRSDEIKYKLPIVKSIIKNNLQLNENRFFARKLSLKKISKEDAKNFFNKNHLMGCGSGRSYALCLNSVPISSIQVKWIKKNNTLEVSRFCSQLSTSVPGGFSRLIKFVSEEEKPKKIVTFIDERYGSGEYLPKLGFVKNETHISFKWTDGIKTFHRMRFRNNSGYKEGLYKIWDCGQTKYTKVIND